MKVIKAPNDINSYNVPTTTMFLAGSIAMGEVEDWQTETTEKFQHYTDEQLVIFNPRRDNFDSTMKQTTDEPVLVEQINWELGALDTADYVLMSFHHDTKAPVTMLEVGLHADNLAKVVVCCPDGFYRQANIEIVCGRYNIPFYKDLDSAINEVCDWIDYDHTIGRYSED